MIPYYEEKYVLFIDILGFKNIIEKTLYNRDFYNIIYEVLTRAYISTPNRFAYYEDKSHAGQGYYIENKENLSKPRVYTFSDSIIITAFLNQYALREIFCLINQLVGHFLDLGIFCRGALVKGQIRDDMQVAFGPAVISAYNMENEIAVNPRIVIEKSLLYEVENLKNNKFDYFPFPFSWPAIIKDEDGYYFYDILNIQPNWIIKDNDCWRNPTWEEWMNRLKRTIIENINMTENDIQKKYIWFANYFNNSLMNKKNAKIEKNLIK